MSCAQVDLKGSCVEALLDFGDISETFAVAEVAITMTYAMLLAMDHRAKRAGEEDGADPMASKGHDVILDSAFDAGKLVLVSWGVLWDGSFNYVLS
jgi:hypothetical protein